MFSTTVKTDANGLGHLHRPCHVGQHGQYELDFAATGYAENAVTEDVTAAP
jgi:hypothetical protein